MGNTTIRLHPHMKTYTSTLRAYFDQMIIFIGKLLRKHTKKGYIMKIYYCIQITCFLRS